MWVKEFLVMDKNKGLVLRIKLGDTQYEKRDGLMENYGANACKSEKESLGGGTKEKEWDDKNYLTDMKEKELDENMVFR